MRTDIILYGNAAAGITRLLIWLIRMKQEWPFILKLLIRHSIIHRLFSRRTPHRLFVLTSISVLVLLQLILTGIHLFIHLLIRWMEATLHSQILIHSVMGPTVPEQQILVILIPDLIPPRTGLRGILYPMCVQ